MTTYNHAFHIAWSVSNSKFEDPADALLLEQEAILDALRRRVEEIDNNRREMVDAIDGFDTYKENN